MGCCYSKDSDDDDDKEQIITRVRTQSRIPPLKKNTSYGALSDEEEISLDKTDANENKEKEADESTLWTKQKPPKSSNKVYGKLAGKKTSKANEPQNPFQTSKKTKLKRAYATKGNQNKLPATKYAQSSPVLGKIKTAQMHTTHSTSSSNENAAKAQGAGDREQNKPYESQTSDKEPLTSKYTQSSSTLKGSNKPQMQGTSLDNSNDSTLHLASGTTFDSNKPTPQYSSEDIGAKEDNMNNETLSSIEKSDSVSDITSTLEVNQKENSMKMKGTSKKTISKKISSKIGKFIPGKKKKKEVKK